MKYKTGNKLEDGRDFILNKFGVGFKVKNSINEFKPFKFKLFKTEKEAKNYIQKNRLKYLKKNIILEFFKI